MFRAVLQRLIYIIRKKEKKRKYYHISTGCYFGCYPDRFKDYKLFYSSRCNKIVELINEKFFENNDFNGSDKVNYSVKKITSDWLCSKIFGKDR